MAAFLIWKAVVPELPTASSPIVFYANQSRQDLKLTLSAAIQSAQHSIFASFYGVTDRDILACLAKKAARGAALTLEYDPTASLALKKRFPETARIVPRASKGLMHRKILVIDTASVFLGTANLTPPSLRHHSNCIIGLYAPEFAAFLSHPQTSQFSFSIGSQTATCHLLPDGGSALEQLLHLLSGAQRTLHIALFTFTHPKIAQALIKAKERGVAVSVIVDYYSAKGASKKTIETLRQAGVTVFLSQGPQLFHHKWAIIDQETFAMGSANWTKAAFTKNEDFLFFLFSLTPAQKNYLEHLWKVLELEANLLL